MLLIIIYVLKSNHGKRCELWPSGGHSKSSKMAIWTYAAVATTMARLKEIDLISDREEIRFQQFYYITKK